MPMGNPFARPAIPADCRAPPSWTGTSRLDPDLQRRLQRPGRPAPVVGQLAVRHRHQLPGGAANWGTGEVESMTSDPANVSLDGAGNLRITPLRSASGAWTSARIETQRTDLAAPVGVHEVFLTFASGQPADFVNVNWFTFGH